MGRNKDIRDDEIRIISASQEKKGLRLWVWLCIAGILGVIITTLMISLTKRDESHIEEVSNVVFEPVEIVEQQGYCYYVDDVFYTERKKHRRMLNVEC